MTRIVAERCFRESTSGACVTARIFEPERIGGSSECCCRIEVLGLETPFERSLVGVDSFQALELAMSFLCKHLERHERSLVFLDGSIGDCALPLIAFCPPSVKEAVRELILSKD